MKSFRALLLLMPALAWAADKPAEFPPIPPEVWTMKDVAGKGAVILSERFQVQNSAALHTLRIRIFNEAGKSAAEIADLPGELVDLKGRTVFPDGRTVLVDSQKDIQTKILVANSAGVVKKKILIPPGLSGDCVVDIQWKEKRYFEELSRYGLGHMESRDWNVPFPIQKLEIEISKRLSWSWNLHPGSFTGRPEVREDKDCKTLVFANIPASEIVPFSLAPSRSMIRFDLFPVTRNLLMSSPPVPQLFWQDLVDKGYKPIFNNRFSKGRAYQDFSEKIRKDVKGTPLEMAGEILMRLDSSLKNTSRLTFAEKSTLETGKIGWEIDPWDVNQTSIYLATNDFGMFLIGYSLLKDQGIQLKLALVADRNQRFLDPNYQNPNQVMNWLLGVESPSHTTVWFDPSMRYAMPGLVHPDFQGTTGVVVDCKDWKTSFEYIGVQAAAFNLSRFNYHLNVGEERDAVILEASFGGAAEYAERSLYMQLETKEQAKTLKESLEQSSKSVTIIKSEVTNATNPRKNLAWKVEGLSERESGRRMEIQPFPFMRWPLTVPTKWPENRTIDIVLPYPNIHLAVSQIKLPKGYTLNPLKFPAQKNEFGSVAWAMEIKPNPEGDDVKIILRVDLNRNIAPASFYPQLKEFVRWVEEACQRTIVVEKSK